MLTVSSSQEGCANLEQKIFVLDKVGQGAAVTHGDAFSYKPPYTRAHTRIGD